MSRRSFIKGSLTGAAAVSVSAPLVANANPTVRWRLTSHLPRSLPLLWAGNENFANIVRDATDGKFQIQVFSAGEIVAPLEAYDAVQSGTVEMASTSMQYFYGKHLAFALMSSMAFGMNTRQMNAWMFEGGGIDLCNSILEKYKLYMLPAGTSGEQMGGFFRKEVKTLADLKGLRFRIPGVAGEILSRIGVIPQMIPGGDVYSALERGTIDATEFTSPYDDEKLGFVKVAPYYYFPTMFEGGSLTHFLFNLQKWNELPPAYQAIVKAAATSANFRMPAAYDVHNPASLKKIVEAGAQLRTFSPEIQQSVFKVAKEYYEEMAKKDADFKLLYDAHIKMRDDMYLWHRIGVFQYDAMMLRLLNPST